MNDKLFILISSLFLVFLAKISNSRYVEPKGIENIKLEEITPVKFWTYEQKKKAYEEDKDILSELEKTSFLEKRSKSSKKKYGQFNFYDQLNDYEKYLYDTITEACAKNPPEFNAIVYSEYIYQNPLNGTELTDYYLNNFMYRQIKVFSAIIYENPEFWWIAQLSPDFVYYNETHMGFNFNLNNEPKYSAYTPDEAEQLNIEIENVRDKIVQDIKKLGLKTKYGIVKFVHDYLVSNIVYTDGLTHSYDLYGAVVEKACVCEGYSESFQYLTKQFGINTIIARSYWHEWNFVEMDNNKYYIIDVTHDDPYVKGPDGNSTSAPLECSSNILNDYFLTGTNHNSTRGVLYKDEYYHELIYNPFRYPEDYMDMFKYPKIEEGDYVPKGREKKEAKIVDAYISKTYNKCGCKLMKNYVKYKY